MIASLRLSLLLALVAALHHINAYQVFTGVGVGRRALKSTKLFSDADSTPEFTPPAPEASPASPATKGFGKAKVATKAAAEEKDAGTRTYETQAKRGVPEYNIFLRPTNGTETEWVPVGSMTIPRDTGVARAVFDVEAELLKGTFKLYPKLRVFYETRSEEKRAGMFEYGYCLKAFPDEQIRTIEREATQPDANFFTNWLGRLTNPLDTSEVENPGKMTLKQ